MKKKKAKAFWIQFQATFTQVSLLEGKTKREAITTLKQKLHEHLPDAAFSSFKPLHIEERK